MLLEFFHGHKTFPCLLKFFMHMELLYTNETFLCLEKFFMTIERYNANAIFHFHTDGTFPCQWNLSRLTEFFNANRPFL